MWEKPLAFSISYSVILASLGGEKKNKAPNTLKQASYIFKTGKRKQFKLRIFSAMVNSTSFADYG